MSQFDHLLGLDQDTCGRCWGLIRRAFAGRGIELPSYDGELTAIERQEIAAIIGAGGAQEPWMRVEEARPWDVLVFRRGRLDAHVGLVTAPGQMLHVDETAPSRIERYDAPRWRPRLTGIYRHHLLA